MINSLQIELLKSSKKRLQYMSQKRKNIAMSVFYGIVPVCYANCLLCIQNYKIKKISKAFVDAETQCPHFKFCSKSRRSFAILYADLGGQGSCCKGLELC